MWKATVQSQRFPAGSWCWWRCDIGMLLIPLLGLSLRSGEVVVSQTHYASPRSKKIPPALTQTPLQLNSFNTFPVLSMYIQQTSGFTEKRWCSEKGSLRRFIQPLIFPPLVCLPVCTVLNDRSAAGCACSWWWAPSGNLWSLCVYCLIKAGVSL